MKADVDGTRPNDFEKGLVFKAHRLVYYSTLGSRVIKKKRRPNVMVALTFAPTSGDGGSNRGEYS